MDPSPQNYVCRSEVVSKPFTFRWEIDRFPLRLMNIGDEYDSSEFEVGDGVPVFVGLKRRKDDADGVEKLSVFLYNASKEKRLKMDFSVTLVNCSPTGKSITDRASATRLFVPNINGKDSAWGWNDFASFASVVDKTSGFLKNGHRMTMLVEGTVFIENAAAIKSEDLDLLDDAFSCIEDFGKLFNEGAFSDFVVKAKNSDGKEREFKVHKLILAARSKFFAAMFSKPELKECREGQMLIEDIDSEAMEALFRFLYTGKIPVQSDLKDIGNIRELELLIAADKYGIMGLKSHLERVLASKLSTENVCERFAVAARHSAPFLGARCREFIRLQATEVVQTDGWTELYTLGDAKLIGSLITGSNTPDGKVIENPNRKSDVNPKKKGSKRFFFF